jgi:hypothetical protein
LPGGFVVFVSIDVDFNDKQIEEDQVDTMEKETYFLRCFG